MLKCIKKELIFGLTLNYADLLNFFCVNQVINTSEVLASE